VPDVVAAIAALDLESVKLRMMDDELGEGWSREYADSIEAAYKTYLSMLVKYPDDAEDILLSKDVDEFWHTHILQTVRYARDCETTFGNFLHHDPHIGERTAADLARREALAEKTRLLYQREFGDQRGAEAAWAGDIRGERGAFSAASVQAGNAAFSAASIGSGQAAFSAASVSPANAAFSAASVQAGNAAFSAANIHATNAAFSAASIKADNAAFSAASIRATNAAFSAASMADNAAFSAASIRSQNAAFSAASIGTPAVRTPQPPAAS